MCLWRLLLEQGVPTLHCCVVQSGRTQKGAPSSLADAGGGCAAQNPQQYVLLFAQAGYVGGNFLEATLDRAGLISVTQQGCNCRDIHARRTPGPDLFGAHSVRFAVAPVTGGRTRRRQQSLPLVVQQRAAGNTAPPRQLADGKAGHGKGARSGGTKDARASGASSSAGL